MATKESKNATVALSDPSKRAEIEAARGIKRDGEGKIILSAAQRKARIARLDQKVADYKTRIKNAESEKKAHLAALK